MNLAGIWNNSSTQNTDMPIMKVDSSTLKVEKIMTDNFSLFKISRLMCTEPAKSMKLSMDPSNQSEKSNDLRNSSQLFKTEGKTVPAAINNKEVIIASNISPIADGSFMKR